jgi:hypothetical protein
MSVIDPNSPESVKRGSMQIETATVIRASVNCVARVGLLWIVAVARGARVGVPVLADRVAVAAGV